MHFFLILLKSLPNFAEKVYQMKQIKIRRKDRNELIRKYGRVNVCKALLYYSDSLMAREIRHIALNEYNGQIINLNF